MESCDFHVVIRERHPFTIDPTNDASWKSVDGQTRRKHVFTGLTGGTRYWFRVATTGASQKSAFSAPVSLVAR